MTMTRPHVTQFTVDRDFERENKGPSKRRYMPANWGGSVLGNAFSRTRLVPRGEKLWRPASQNAALGIRERAAAAIFDGSGLRLACTMTAWLRDKPVVPERRT